MLERPTELADIVTKEDFKKAQAYNLDKSRFGFIESLYKQIETVFLLQYDALPYIWDASGNILYTLTGYGTEYEVIAYDDLCWSSFQHFYSTCHILDSSFSCFSHVFHHYLYPYCNSLQPLFHLCC